MQNNLVIVESPAKAKTIEKFLGKEYHVMSSFGHIRDLDEHGLGIDIEHDYAPQYVIPADKKKVVSELKAAAKKADTVWLASDEDREGEAIAWHLHTVLELDGKPTHRIVFHEITRNAILHAIETPRDININVVDAQQARRVLDRIVGFELSPVLWRKIKPSLSAGRVQSVTVRLVVEREREISNFTAEASYRVSGTFSVEAGDRVSAFKAELKRRFATEDEARAFVGRCNGARFTIESIEKHPTVRKPYAPFTTSTLQQEASRKFGFPVSTTMRVAQQLYENGKITYMRTDSVNLSELAINTAKAEIESTLGKRYLHTRRFVTKSKGAQEAHEAIRPTYINVHTIEGSAQEQRLYELIWKRTIASQMADAEFEKTTVTIAIDGSEEKFVATGEVMVFDGFLNVYMESVDEEPDSDENTTRLPALSVGSSLAMTALEARQRYTQRPPRYTEASLVRKLEELGIGRPSTYAPTISTIMNRGYVEKREITNRPLPYRIITLKDGNIQTEERIDKPTVEKGKLSPTDIGIVVNDFLTEHFPNIMDYQFTAKVEEGFDLIAEGKEVWTDNINRFYTKFHPNVEIAANLTGRKAGERELGKDPVSGDPVFVKIGRFGPVAQIGAAKDDAKPRFASLRAGQSIETITLDEALDLFRLPVDLGEWDGEHLSIGVGRFGPYVRHGKMYVSIPKGEDPLSVSRERAVELVEEKLAADSKRLIMRFEAEDIEVLNGRFGPYIAHAGANYKLPKGIDASALSLDECKKIISDDSAKSKGTRRRAAVKTAAKATVTKAAKTSNKSTATKTKAAAGKKQA
ncbi:MAG: type I DNA topoisomerase [Candidatus Aphodosoma sp.]